MNGRIILFLLFSFVSLFSAGQITRNACTDQPVRIVILGSSTAAGSGPSHPDSTWVNKYRKNLKLINPQNEVINLAVGGYTTYRIMPDNFVTPANRPAVDSTHNITEALSLNPDAIIVNLPSNDRSWPMSEQLGNFDSLYSHSQNNGVPMYICTTQPIQGNWGVYQSSVKDSILAMFGPNAIDFFTPLADPNGNVYPNFAADAVHLNDSGHAVLFNQVWNKDILVDIAPTSPGVELVAIDLFVQGQACAGNQTNFSVAFANLGDVDATPVEIKIVIDGIDSVQSLVPFLVTSCSKPVIWFGDSLAPGTHRFDVTLLCPQDTTPANNTITVYRTFHQQPESGIDSKQYFCLEDSAHRNSTPLVGDTLLWFDSSYNPIAPTSFQFEGDTAFFALASTGPFTNKGILNCSPSDNITFNGNMFNLIADSTVTLSELRFISASSGTLYPIVDIYNGNYRGNENTASAWTRLIADTVNVANIGDSIVLPIHHMIQRGDTLGVYVHFAVSNQSLAYQAVNSPVTFKSDALTFQSGSGVAYNFGTVYDNRAIAASIEYDYGFNPQGKCAANLQYVQFLKDSLFLDWPDDTTAGWTGRSFQVDPAYSNITWRQLPTGTTLSTSSFVWIDSTVSYSDFDLELSLESPMGCLYVDTIRVKMQNDIGLSEHSKGYEVYPNPTNADLNLSGFDLGSEFQLVDLTGRVVKRGKVTSALHRLSMRELLSGVYVLTVETSGLKHNFRVVLTDD
ncbi:SGNH/GDSL hydrolase family protein [Phaeocystidibacter luteus]|uniref:T9SS type A sorting domain-containing protein n=1 Tax=Phaeocystidibacter luteus TaxID=911197 RepID=A0A6N6RFE6_9FLAO|nr:SGNH/GDSL hydrolase family protein [Phaeocystidibacter luteus]KAB2809881.1 T9SS type A sorting domain-containing protein [Phaeocystidibacter luteus]